MQWDIPDIPISRAPIINGLFVAPRTRRMVVLFPIRIREEEFEIGKIFKHVYPREMFIDLLATLVNVVCVICAIVRLFDCPVSRYAIGCAETSLPATGL